MPIIQCALGLMIGRLWISYLRLDQHNEKIFFFSSDSYHLLF